MTLSWQNSLEIIQKLKNLNMTICNMTIFSEMAKYDYLQYEYLKKSHLSIKNYD